MDLAEGSTIFLIVVAVLLIAVAYTLFTRTGSAINQRPNGWPWRRSGGDGTVAARPG